MSEEMIENVARALYEHWVAENVEDDWAGWERLRDKDTWRERAKAAVSAYNPNERLREALEEAEQRFRNVRSGLAVMRIDVPGRSALISHVDAALRAIED